MEIVHYVTDPSNPQLFCGGQGQWESNENFDGKPGTLIGSFKDAMTACKSLVTCKHCLAKIKEYDNDNTRNLL
jgi:hypothetical protein